MKYELMLGALKIISFCMGSYILSIEAVRFNFLAFIKLSRTLHTNNLYLGNFSGCLRVSIRITKWYNTIHEKCANFKDLWQRGRGTLWLYGKIMKPFFVSLCIFVVLFGSIDNPIGWKSVTFVFLTNIVVGWSRKNLKLSHYEKEVLIQNTQDLNTIYIFSYNMSLSVIFGLYLVSIQE